MWHPPEQPTCLLYSVPCSVSSMHSTIGMCILENLQYTASQRRKGQA
jgi:hypothetical protein